MAEVGALYMVRFWIRPDALDAVLGWLDGGHIAEVVETPGFLWARRVRLTNEEAADDGWPGYAMIYGVESLDALDAYFKSDAPGRFAAERAEKGLDALMRVERDWGVVEFTAGSGTG
jgi:Domain of unknown function (DUF4286)